jgi:tetratricopeptide (TPR) repeat protein
LHPTTRSCWKSADVLERLGRLKEGAQQYVNVAEIYLAQRDLEKAIGNWERATRLSSGLVQIHQRLALAYERTGQRKNAIRDTDPQLQRANRTTSPPAWSAHYDWSPTTPRRSIPSRRSIRGADPPEVLEMEEAPSRSHRERSFEPAPLGEDRDVGESDWRPMARRWRTHLGAGVNGRGRRLTC